jgi:hypothetical protein
MALTYADFTSATGITVPVAETTTMLSQANMTALINELIEPGGDFYDETLVEFDENNYRHRKILWLMVKRAIIEYRNNQAQNGSQQTPVGTITSSSSTDGLISGVIEKQLNLAVNKLKLNIGV